MAQAAGGGDAVPQAGDGERSADLYTCHESCVNRAVLLRCLSAIHSFDLCVDYIILTRYVHRIRDTKVIHVCHMCES